MPKVEAAEVAAEAEHVCCEAGEAVVSEVEGGQERAGGQPGGRQVAQQVVGEREAVQARQPLGTHRHYITYNEAASCSISSSFHFSWFRKWNTLCSSAVSAVCTTHYPLPVTHLPGLLGTFSSVCYDLARGGSAGSAIRNQDQISTHRQHCAKPEYVGNTCTEAQVSLQ